ncbi:hypothetical protein EVA_19687 [gut metagenome]|uniref:Uncharacterized protein n=1 Tax=gut metagenome TaxID=749906 RepID=J9FXX5_9ZZZZ
MVGHPSLVVARVLSQQGEFTRFEIETVRVEDFGVAAVHTDEHKTGLFLQVVNKAGAHPGKVGIGAKFGAVGTDAKELVVFIARRVFHEEQTVVVSPHISRHTSLRFAGDAYGGFVGGLNRANKDIEAVGIGGHIRKVSAIGRKLITSAFGITEEVFQRNLSLHERKYKWVNGCNNL